MNAHHKFALTLGVMALIYAMAQLGLSEATIIGVVGLLVAFGRDLIGNGNDNDKKE